LFAYYTIVVLLYSGVNLPETSVGSGIVKSMKNRYTSFNLNLTDNYRRWLH